jgi:hypothetical protein
LLVGLLCSSPSVADEDGSGPTGWFCLKSSEGGSVCFPYETGPRVPIDAETFAKQQAALQGELERRANEARRRIKPERVQPAQ